MVFGFMAILAQISFAEEVKVGNILQKIPALKQGFAYSLVDSQFNYLSTIELMKWKRISLEVGYAGRAENTGDKAVLVASVDLLDMSDVITFPILDKIVFRPGIYFGGNINVKSMTDTESDWGVSASFIDLKF
jgi:hypothetical protein